jgi:hypothetical protein
MLGKYTGDSYKTYQKITNDINRYYANEIYHNKKYDKYFFINSKGYLHVYIMENKSIIEYMLTKDNELKYVDTIILITENQKNNFVELLKNAIQI